MKSLTKINLRKLPASKKTRALIGLIVLATTVAIVAVVLSVNKNNQTSNTTAQTGNPIARIDELQRTGDCEKGLEELSSFDTQSKQFSDPVHLAESIKVLTFRIGCNTKLKKYDEALRYANQLMEIYEKQGGTSREKQNLVQIIENIRLDQATDIRNMENQKKQGPKDSYNGPYL